MRGGEEEGLEDFERFLKSKIEEEIWCDGGVDRMKLIKREIWKIEIEDLGKRKGEES